MPTTAEPPPLPAWGLLKDQTTPRLPFTAALPAAVRLDLKYRPTTLGEVMGQEEAVAQLKSFAASPYSCAIFIEGSTGLGKTSAAYALANDLGVDRDWNFSLIKSAEANRDDIDRALKILRFVGMNDGWKFVLVDEAHSMSPTAVLMLHSALENLPAKSIVVFTSDQPDRFPDSFMDRCVRIKMAPDGPNWRAGLQLAINRVWLGETGSMDDAPTVDDLPEDIYRRGVISFRRAVSALEPKIRDAIARRAAERIDAGRPVLIPVPIPVEPAPAPAPVKPAPAPAPASPATPPATPRPATPPAVLPADPWDAPTGGLDGSRAVPAPMAPVPGVRAAKPVKPAPAARSPRKPVPVTPAPPSDIMSIGPELLRRQIDNMRADLEAMDDRHTDLMDATVDLADLIAVRATSERYAAHDKLVKSYMSLGAERAKLARQLEKLEKNAAG